MSLIMIQEIIEQVSNKFTLKLSNEIAVNIADTDQSNYKNSTIDYIDYDNFELEVVGHQFLVLMQISYRPTSVVDAINHIS